MRTSRRPFGLLPFPASLPVPRPFSLACRVPGARRALAPMAQAVSLAVLLTLGPLQVAQAQSDDGPMTVDIAAQPLVQALTELARQTGTTLVAAPALLAGRKAPALSGSLTAQQALDKLLAGSGLTGSLEGGVLTVRQAAQASGTGTLPTVTVTARAERADGLPQVYSGGQVARGGQVGLLGNQDFMDTPLSIASYTAQVIEDQQPRTVGELLARNDASVRVSGGDTSSTEDTVIRGFSVESGSDYALNGLPGLVAQFRSSTEFIERAEVLKGPSAMLSGMAPSGSSGGTINLVAKRAQDEPLTRLTTTYLSDSRLGLHADVGRRFGENKEWGVRFNGAWRQGDTVRDDQDEKRWLGALGLDYRSNRLRVSLDVINQESRQRGARGALNGAGDVGVLPAAPAGRRNLDQPWALLGNTDRTVMARAEYDLSPDLVAWFSMGHTKGVYGGKDAMGGNVYLVNAAGDTVSEVSAAEFFMKTMAANAGLRGRFRTGPIGHTWSLNASSLKRDVGWGFHDLGTFESNIYRPVRHLAPAYSPASTPSKTSDTNLPSIALADTLSFVDERLLLTLGVRRQTVKTRNYDEGLVTSRYDESAITPFAGLIVRPWADVSLYASYAEGLAAGDTAPMNAGNRGEVLPPYKARQYEVGAKYDAGRFAATAALFQISRPSASLDADDVFAVNGQQRNRGLEVSVFGEVMRGVHVLGGVTLLDAKLTRTPTGADEGRRAVGTSKVAANLGAEWDVTAVPGLTAMGGIIHTSDAYVDVGNKVRAPGWTRTDLGLRYRTRLGGNATILRATVENVFDKAYWVVTNDWGGVNLGMPRTLLLSASVDF